LPRFFFAAFFRSSAFSFAFFLSALFFAAFFFAAFFLCRSTLAHVYFGKDDLWGRDGLMTAF
jgi:hypothetical protein